MKLFNYIFNKIFLKFYLSQQNKPVTHKDLDYAFTDDNGKRYYQFTMNQAIPMNRFENLKKYIAFMELRFNPDNVDQIIDKVLGYVEAGLKEKQNAVRASALLLELKDRKDKIIPAELIYNYLAVLYVREDEDPMSVDNDMHMNKIVMFKESSAKKDGFFFHLSELKKLKNSLVLSHEEWKTYLDESHSQHAKLLERIRVFTSEE